MVKEKEELVNLGALYFPGQLKLGATGLVRNLVFKIEIKNDREGCPILVNASTNTSAEVDTQPHKTKINKRSGSKQHTKTVDTREIHVNTRDLHVNTGEIFV